MRDGSGSRPGKKELVPADSGRQVQPGSPAMKAGLAVGDEIVEIDGQPASVSTSDHAKMLLFGKIGEKRALVYRRGSVEQSATLTLAARTQADKNDEASADTK
jgi:S1-C subfamily serine protease